MKQHNDIFFASWNISSLITGFKVHDEVDIYASQKTKNFLKFRSLKSNVIFGTITSLCDLIKNINKPN